MKITKRRILVLTLAMMMVFSQLSLTSFAADNEENEIEANPIAAEAIEDSAAEAEDPVQDEDAKDEAVEAETETATETPQRQDAAQEDEPQVMAAAENDTQIPEVQATADGTTADIYFSDRDVESYYGERNNMYFTPLYVLVGDRREIAYCYNGTKMWAPAAPGRPGFSIEGTHDEQYYIDNGMYYTKLDNPSAQDWADNSESNADEETVKRILYNGYPYNANGIQDKYNLEDIAYRAVTQAAIWKVTSGVSLKAALGDFTYTGYTWTQDMTLAYNELINNDMTLEAPANFMMDLYLAANTNYQNLLSTGLTKDENPDDTTVTEPQEPEEEPEETSTDDTPKTEPEENSTDDTPKDDKITDGGSSKNSDDKSVSAKKSNVNHAPETGDNSPVYVLTVIMLLSAGAVMVLRRKARR